MAKVKGKKKALAKLIEGLSAASREAVKAARTSNSSSTPSGDLSGIKPKNPAKGCGGCD